MLWPALHEYFRIAEQFHTQAEPSSAGSDLLSALDDHRDWSSRAAHGANAISQPMAAPANHA